MKRLIVLAAITALLAGAAPAWAEPAQVSQVQDGSAVCCCQPARFQIFRATGTYGGLIMLDTKTGESYQRVIVNTATGISIKWLQLDRVKKLSEQQTIVWE